VQHVASGPSACHSIIICDDGTAMSFGGYMYTVDWMFNILFFFNTVTKDQVQTEKTFCEDGVVQLIF